MSFLTGSQHCLSIGFVLLPRFTLLPFAAFVDCLRLAGDEGDMSRQLRCRWTFMTSEGHDAQSSCGAGITPCSAYRDPSEFDYLVVIAGVLDNQEMVDKRTLAYLKWAEQSKVPLIGLCTGVFALLQTGLMHHRRCCVSWYHHDDLVRRFPHAVPVSDQLYIDDGDRLTCAGGIASADLAAYLVERHLGRIWARKSLYIMLINEARRGNTPQPHPMVWEKVDNRIVRRAISILEQHLGELISIDELAERTGCSRRALERNFRESLSVSPQKFSRDLRLRYGLWLLKFTARSITEVGEHCGFADTAHFSRHFKKAFGHSPSDIRKNDVILEEELIDPFFLHIGKSSR
ncbi:AraC family transcriptional regulator with amidase-like domain [Kushneria marisflavi]|uniref:GlxA family transcriptional regulator n=2 Tax=Halomonadaceae TaxID=28256 RepID=UPI000FF7D731|nr:GlxA family transcriptional regulator [Kushneria marisflavi]RKD84180.1 AraC family transcriptional regulator with amidase-like domain [Kushneria marisflavi]